MTETLERPKIDEHELQHLDFDILCEDPGCEHAADWWMVCLSCAEHTPVCEPHRRAKVLRAESAPPSHFVLCPSCDQAVRARAWRLLYAFVPIGRP